QKHKVTHQWRHLETQIILTEIGVIRRSSLLSSEGFPSSSRGGGEDIGRLCRPCTIVNFGSSLDDISSEGRVFSTYDGHAASSGFNDGPSLVVSQNKLADKCKGL